MTSFVVEPERGERNFSIGTCVPTGMIRNARKTLFVGVELIFRANMQPAVGVVVHLG